MIPPSSHNISDNLTEVGKYPMFTNGASADVWEGTYYGRKVCIKRLRVSIQSLPSVTQVRAYYQHVPPASAEENLWAP